MTQGSGGYMTRNRRLYFPCEYRAFQIFQSMAGLGSLSNLEFGNKEAEEVLGDLELCTQRERYINVHFAMKVRPTAKQIFLKPLKLAKYAQCYVELIPHTYILMPGLSVEMMDEDITEHFDDLYGCVNLNIH